MLSGYRLPIMQSRLILNSVVLCGIVGKDKVSYFKRNIFRVFSEIRIDIHTGCRQKCRKLTENGGMFKEISRIFHAGCDSTLTENLRCIVGCSASCRGYDFRQLSCRQNQTKFS